VGRVDPSQVFRYYAEADIYVQTPDIDNMPLSVLEAYASGLPVVSTNAGGVPYILEHERQGLLADTDDAEGVAAAVLRLLEEPALASQVIEGGRRQVETYTWPQVRDRWLAVYRALAAPRVVNPRAVEYLR
jgi:glycosyltransferase involved in cell wall biosynthesis